MNILKAKEHTKDIFRNMKKTADSWRLIAFGLLAANIALAAGFAAVASQNRVVPYIVQVDEHGYEIAVKPAEELPQIDERIIIARVGTFVERLRTVVSDSDAQKNYMRWVYASIPEGSQALAATNAFYKDNDPFKEAAALRTKMVEVLSVLPISKDTWRAQWRETISQNGTPQESSEWSGLFTVGMSPVKEMRSVIRNPLGIYIVEYSMTPNYS